MSSYKARYWHRIDEKTIQCDLCPHRCKVKEGKKGNCLVRGQLENELVLLNYGKVNAMAIDPIEKKPLNHFLPGSKVFSIGTVGCNLNCKFCQNWQLSKMDSRGTYSKKMTPEEVVSEAEKAGCESIAFTYNDPVIFLEYAMDIAEIAKKRDLKTVAVTAGYINNEPREEFFSKIDAANVDLKAFSESFYKKMTGGSLGIVLDTLKYIAKETEAWLEITTLLVPGENDSTQEIHSLTQWIFENIGADVPLHFSAFHPSYHIQNKERTPIETLKRARKIALENGLHHVFTGNVQDLESSSSYCQDCKCILIERELFNIKKIWVDGDGLCKHCGAKNAGIFK